MNIGYKNLKLRPTQVRNGSFSQSLSHFMHYI